MFKKNPSAFFITLFSTVVSIAGIFNNLTDTRSMGMVKFRVITDPLSLGWAFSSDLLFRTNGHNYVNLVVDVLLFIGVIASVSSKNTRTALIRFFFSIVFFSKVLSFSYGIFSFLFAHHHSYPLNAFFIDLGFYTAELFWIYCSYIIIRSLGLGKVYKQTVTDKNGSTEVLFYKALMGQRFFHPFIDTFLTIMIFSQLISQYYLSHNHNFFSYVPDNFVMSLLIPLRIVYYLFYETVLGATPAKYLTQTRVVDYNGDKPGFKSIMLRTLSRLVPFEAFSFFTDDGWHDKWSATVVSREIEQMAESVNEGDAANGFKENE